MHVGKYEEPDSHDYGSKDACNTRAKAVHKITASGSENAGLELFDGKPKRDGRQAPSKGVPYVFDEDRETYLEDTKTGDCDFTYGWNPASGWRRIDSYVQFGGQYGY